MTIHNINLPPLDFVSIL
jgi:hypothetical protein